MPIPKGSRKSIKPLAIRIVRDLPVNASWEDLMYQLYVRQKIEAGCSDLRKGKVHKHSAIEKEFGPPL